MVGRSVVYLCKEVTAATPPAILETTGTAARLMTRMMATAAVKEEDPASERVASGLERPIEKEDGKPHSPRPPESTFFSAIITLFAHDDLPIHDFSANNFCRCSTGAEYCVHCRGNRNVSERDNFWRPRYSHTWTWTRHLRRLFNFLESIGPRP